MKYLVEVEKGAEAKDGRPSVGPVYRSIFAKDGFPPPVEGVETCWDVFRSSAMTYPENRMLGRREIINGKAGKYVWLTYKEVYDLVMKIGTSIRSCGVNQGDRCGIYGANCPEWIMSMEACNAHGIFCVPLYDTLGAGVIEFIICHAEVSIVFVEEKKIPEMMKALPNSTKFLKTIVSFGKVTPEQKIEAESFGLKIYAWDEFLVVMIEMGISSSPTLETRSSAKWGRHAGAGKMGPIFSLKPWFRDFLYLPVSMVMDIVGKGNEGNNQQYDLPKMNKTDICTIMYTSGTTGDPKGVMLSNESIVTLIAGVKLLLDRVNEQLHDGDVYLSYLPLAHIFDRVMEETFLSYGASIGFWRGDVKLLVEDVGELKPTIFVAVPRVLERIYAGLQDKISAGGFLKHTVFNIGYKYKQYNMRKGRKHSDAAGIFHKIVFSKVKEGLGGKVRIILSGAAPLANHVEDYLRVVSCSHVMQGYGLTETCGGTFVSLPDEYSMMGTVGPPLPNVEVRLESVPEMGYDALSSIPSGEVCVRGKTLFSGYYKRENLTEEVMIDGWFHTGDIGQWQPDGSLKIIDRKKNIFKLSQGEYVAVENLENIYGSVSGIDSIWVYGSSFESFLVAVVSPNKQALERWAEENGVTGDFSSLCENHLAKAHVLAELSKTAKAKKLKGFEFIRAVHLDPVPFDIDRDLMTPSFKKKRPQLLKYYQSAIDGLYRSAK